MPGNAEHEPGNADEPVAARDVTPGTSDSSADSSFGWRWLRMRSQSRHSERAVRTKRSAIAFAFGDLIGVLMISTPSLRRTLSKVTRELAVAVADEEANGRRSLRQGPGELSCLLGHPGTIGLMRAAGEVDAPAAKLDAV
jgi:hypothetical protein